MVIQTEITMTNESARNWPQIYLGVMLTTLATLILELSLTRIFSVVFFYHFAVLAISVALFGLGLGGIFSYMVAAWKGKFFANLGGLAALNSLVVVGTLMFVLSLGSDLHFWTLTVVYFASTVPFFFAGTVVSLVIAETIERVDRVYFYDLLGAAAGCLLLIPLLNSLGGPSTVIAAAALFAVSAAVWFHLAAASGRRNASLALSLVLVLLAVLNAKGSFIDVKYAKGNILREELFVQWNSFSRIAVVGKADKALSIEIDADAETAMVQLDLDEVSPQSREANLAVGPGMPYLVRPGAKTLIIGPGGGVDVFRALISGSRDVTGVEINPIIATTVMRERFVAHTHGLYLRPEVRIFVEDGRSFVRRSQEKYQVLQATLVDTWASTAAGAFALSENNLYTVEAFQDYLSHLTADGILAFTRWGFEPPRESLRLVSLAMEALERLGEREPWRHVIVGREENDTLDTVIVSRKPLAEDEITRLRMAFQRVPVKLLYLPGDLPSNAFGELLLSSNSKQYQRDYYFDITPVSDNRPFFFYTVQPRDVWAFFWSYIHKGWSQREADFKINVAVPLLYGLVAVSLIATILMLAFPPLLLGSRLPREKGVLRFLLFFVAIGMGYILIEVALIQKFILFLSHPTYALAVIVFSMLVFSGIGSYFSRYLLSGTAIRLQFVLLAVALLVAVLTLTVSPATAAGMGWPLPLRAMITVLMIAPVAFLMGMPFPTGLKLLENLHNPSVRWAWSLNAAASVLGSVSSIFFAIYIGLRETLMIGGTMYLCALALVHLSFKRTSR